jgi:hypothetical protein
MYVIAADCHPVLEGGLTRALDDRTVRERVGVRDSDLQRRDARVREPLPHLDRPFARRVAGHDVCD